MDFLFVSPHYDDVVGACGGLVNRLSATSSVSITTVFTAPPDKISPFAKEIHDLMGLGSNAVLLRQQEDIAACNILGCERQDLEFQDAIYRFDDNLPLYSDTPTLFSRPAPQDNTLPDKIWKKLSAGLDSTTALFFPLGKGGHVDHIIVSTVGSIAKRNGYKAAFYEEFYYDDAPYHHVTQHDLPSTEDITLNEDELRLKEQAFLAYESQIPMLFRGEDSIRAYFQSTRVDALGRPVERFVGLSQALG